MPERPIPLNANEFIIVDGLAPLPPVPENFFVEDVPPGEGDVLEIQEHENAQDIEEFVGAGEDAAIHEPIFGAVIDTIAPLEAYRVTDAFVDVRRVRYEEARALVRYAIHNARPQYGMMERDTRQARLRRNAIETWERELRHKSRVTARTEISVVPTVEELDNPAWLVEHAQYVPRGWNAKRLGNIIKTRLEKNIDPDLFNATFWLKEFEMPAEKNGEQLHDRNAEENLVLALIFGQNPEKLPQKPQRIEKLFHSEDLKNVYIAILGALQHPEGGEVDLLDEKIIPTTMAGLISTIQDCQKYGLRITNQQQASVLNRLRVHSQRRDAYVHEAQRWLETHATSPRQLLVEAWKNRDAALIYGAEDNPRSIKAWVDANSIRAAYHVMARDDKAPANLCPEDLDTFEAFINEMARCFDTTTVLDTISKHKEIFNSEALLPAYNVQLEEGWRAEILSKDDPRGYTIGDDTGCCMRPGDGPNTNARNCLVAGYSDPRYSFFALYDEAGRIAAQSLVYVNPDDAPDTLVIDNIETNKGRSRDEVLARYRQFFLEYTGNAAAGSVGDITKVHLGIHNRESYSTPLKAVRPIATPLEGTYTDAGVQRLLLERDAGIEGIKLWPLSPVHLPLINILETEIYETTENSHAGNNIDSIHQPDNFTYLITDDNEKGPAGYVVAYISKASSHFSTPGEDEEVLYIDDLAIKPDYQNRGFGRQVLGEMIRCAQDRKVSILFHAKDASSWKILQSRTDELTKMGLSMTIIGEDPDYYQEGEGTHLIMLSVSDQAAQMQAPEAYSL